MAEKIVSLEAYRGHAGGGMDDDRPPEDDAPSDRCPITALGHNNGNFFFFDFARDRRKLSARALGSRSELQGLFLGHSEWLETNFPQTKAIAKTVNGNTVYDTVDSGWSASNAAAWLMRQCEMAGIYGDHVEECGVGIWRGDDGFPVVNTGAELLLQDATLPSGQRIGDKVWLIDSRKPKPAEPCDVAVARDLVEQMSRLWSFRSPGGAMVMTGLIGVGYLGSAARWRSSGFVVAPSASGKTMLHNLIRACLPMHVPTNNTSASGIQGSMTGHAMPVIIDEAASSSNQEGIRRIMDIVLGASGGDGVEGLRGTADGGVRRFKMAASFLYFSTETPALGDAHLGRITVVELQSPKAGADHRDLMEALTEKMRKKATALWGRALARFDDWRKAVDLFREGLRRAGCAPREMDQMSAILASHHVLTEDGLPNDLQVRQAIAATTDFIRTVEDVREDDTSRRALEFLLAQQVQYDGTTRKTTIGDLLDRAWNVDESSTDTRHGDARPAIECLMRNGIRPIRHWERETPQNRQVPRGGDGDGIWLLPVAVDGLFRGSEWEPGRKWQRDLLQLPHSKGPVKYVIRFGGQNAGKGVWMSRKDIDRDEPVPFAEMVELSGLTPTAFLGLMDRHGDRFPRALDADRYEDWAFDKTRTLAFIARVTDAGDG